MNGWGIPGGILFSHPKGTSRPLCTTELGYMAKLKPEFDQRNVKVIGLSVDAVGSHADWAKDIEETQGDGAQLPDDRRSDHNLEALRMLPAERSATRQATESESDRAQCLHHRPRREGQIDIHLPVPSHRNFDDMLRVMDSMQLTAKHKVATPATGSTART